MVEQLVQSGVPVEKIAEALPTWALKQLARDPGSREEMAHHLFR
jgi:hypothetical protein